MPLPSHLLQMHTHYFEISPPTSFFARGTDRQRERGESPPTHTHTLPRGMVALQTNRPAPSFWDFSHTRPACFSSFWSGTGITGLAIWDQAALSTRSPHSPFYRLLFSLSPPFLSHRPVPCRMEVSAVSPVGAAVQVQSPVSNTLLLCQKQTHSCSSPS